MSIFKSTLLTWAALSLFFIASPVLAQKSKDTLRIGFYDPISIVDATHDPKPETGLLSRSVYDNLLAYDRKA
ncbi:MAG: hypothetical protein VX693_08345, partial [Pseudomonadota bacterium]|nr:hypothetical protein [Pseudomonadota bacterium]